VTSPASKSVKRITAATAASALLVKVEMDWSGLDYKSTDYAGARIIGGAQYKNNPSRKSMKN